jgi:hypothetical protein
MIQERQFPDRYIIRPKYLFIATATFSSSTTTW